MFCEFEGAKGRRMAANSEVGGDISKRSSGDMGRDSWSSTRSLRPRAGIWMGSDVERLNWASSVVEIIVMMRVPSVAFESKLLSQVVRASQG